MKRDQLIAKAMPSILGFLAAPAKNSDLYSLWFKVRFDSKRSMTSLRTVVAKTDFDALKSAFSQVLKEGKRGKLIGFTLIREQPNAEEGPQT